MTHIGYAPIAEDGNLWVDCCEGQTYKQFRIYENRETAEKNKAAETDKVVKVTIEVEGEQDGKGTE